MKIFQLPALSGYPEIISIANICYKMVKGELASAWISNHTLSKVWDEIIYPFPNFNGATGEVWEMISYSIQHFIMEIITYPYWD